MEYLRAVVKGQLMGAVETRNMFEYMTEGTTWGQSDIDAISSHLAGMFHNVRSILAQTFTAYDIEFYQWNEAEWQPVWNEAMAEQGSGAVGFAAYQTAMVINGVVSGFKSHARKFLAGIGEDLPINGRIPLQPLAVLATFAAAWLAPVTNGSVTWYPGVLGKGAVWHSLIGTEAMGLLGTMRKRKPGYGI